MRVLLQKRKIPEKSINFMSVTIIGEMRLVVNGFSARTGDVKGVR
jgi:hypothetical protein